MSHSDPPPVPESSRRSFLGLSAGFAALACTAPGATSASQSGRGAPTPRLDYPVLVGSANALPGMKKHYRKLKEGAPPLDVAIEVVKLAEANEKDHSVGLGGLPNEDGVVQLDAAVMDGRTHNSGAVACLENIVHPSEVARLVMERTDHCMIVGRGAYEFARAHGVEHRELLTPEARRIWLHWLETHSDRDDRLPPPERDDDDEQGSLTPSGAGEDRLAGTPEEERVTGTIHCSALAVDGNVACTTTTSGLSWKIPGRVGDSPIIGAGLYCDAEAGSAGATGRGEAAILSHGSSAIVELLRGGMAPLDAGMELMRRVTAQAQRAAAWQPGLVDDEGIPTFNLSFYILGLDGRFAGVRLRGEAAYAVAFPGADEPQHMTMSAYHG